MNKLGVVLGVAAVVTLAGCVDPNYRKPSERAQNSAKNVETAAPAQETVEQNEATPVEPTKEVEVKSEEKKCTCAPNTKHTEPCACQASDCKCVVDKPEEKPAEETTTYIVQRGDYLAKISKKYNITIAGIRRVNPQLKDDKIKVGQKIQLPGKIDVGEQKVPEGAIAKSDKPVAAKTAYKPYTGATKEYVVKSGDTLGAIAYGNGINIRQLKEMNKLSSDSLRIGQKLKIPAEKVVATKATLAATKETKAVAPVQEKKMLAPAQDKKAENSKAAANAPTTVVTEEPKVAPAQAAEPKAEATAAAAAPAQAEEYVVYEVQQGEDIIALSVRFDIGPGEIRELNNLSETDELKAGQKIRIPANTQL